MGQGIRFANWLIEGKDQQSQAEQPHQVDPYW